jgi:hypothetical protein
VKLADCSILSVSGLKYTRVATKELCQGALPRALIGMNIRRWHWKKALNLPASRARMPSSQLVSIGLRR